jgi:cbb3-type cytochrome oxidase maturation protein
MEIIYFLIGCSILLAVIFLGAFFWASKSGQHDDTITPAIRILFDDEPSPEDANHNKEELITKKSD